MYNFLIGKFLIQNAQRSINRLNPKVAVQLPRDLPLPSVWMIQRMCAVVSKINGLEERFAAMTDAELRAMTDDLKRRYQEAIREKREECRKQEEDMAKAETDEERDQMDLEIEKVQKEFVKTKQKALDAILPEAFAVVREASKRTTGLRHFDTQMVGGMVLHEGCIAEMATGEGKTLVATLPAYLNALAGEGVSIVTVNDYLAKRDREWMGPIYEFLGLTVGVIQHDMDPSERQQNYACDITYGTNNEFGFDYLRDNMVVEREDMVQRSHFFAIVDEVDSILVDEARTPLIISGPAEQSTDTYYKARDIAERLKGRRITEHQEIEAKHRNEDLTVGYDYVSNEKQKSVSISEEGEVRIAQMFGVPNLHDMETIEYRHHILQALKAREFFRRDVEYVVRDGQVIIVDEFTGRLMPGRRWSDGLHQAVEAKEGIKIERENQTLATITLQNYFRMYEKLSGMTGTAHTEANEFKQIYNLDCVVMPTNRKLQRVNHTDCIYRSQREKYEAVVKEIEDCYHRGQPVLVGTISIEKSELLSTMLKRKGVPHQVLNAKYHEMEAQIVSQAGRFKAVTIATNMAGRGTDIMLGGNAEFLAKSLTEATLQQKEKEREKTKEAAPDVAQERDALVKKFLEQFRGQVKKEHEQVVAAGGLHVLGTERHESRRIDNQLRGRSGRQGDPGSSRFYVSLEDELMRLFASDRIIKMMDSLGMEEGQVIEHPWVSKSLEIAQKRVETHNFEIRKQLLEYDNVMNKQRAAVYSLRRSVLESESIKDRILIALDDVVQQIVEQHYNGNADMEKGPWDAEGLETYLKNRLNFDITPWRDMLKDGAKDEVRQLIADKLAEVYETKERQISPEHLRRLEKMVFLNTMDAKWKDHLYAMDQLKEGVGLRSYAQRDPLVEYKKEGYFMFQMLFNSLNQEIVETVFKVRPMGEGMRLRGVFNSLPQQLIHQDFTSLSRDAAPMSSPESGPAPAGRERPAPTAPIQNTGPRVGRNDPCPCGSGKKYKKCCGA